MNLVLAGVVGPAHLGDRGHAAEGIRVNAMCPGSIFTRFHERRATAAGEAFDDFKGGVRAQHHAQAAGHAPGSGRLHPLPASDEASYVTGTCLFVDGGQTSL